MRKWIGLALAIAIQGLGATAAQAHRHDMAAHSPTAHVHADHHGGAVDSIMSAPARGDHHIHVPSSGLVRPIASDARAVSVRSAVSMPYGTRALASHCSDSGCAGAPNADCGCAVGCHATLTPPDVGAFCPPGLAVVYMATLSRQPTLSRSPPVPPPRG